MPVVVGLGGGRGDRWEGRAGLVRPGLRRWGWEGRRVIGVLLWRLGSGWCGESLMVAVSFADPRVWGGRSVGGVGGVRRWLCSRVLRGLFGLRSRGFGRGLGGRVEVGVLSAWGTGEQERSRRV